ncbi:MAG: single-stranded DNA-binding protein [Actinomycetota bacterium]|nr:single-stranded DNA-binding protein [Actinomycetota bacterium]
MLQGRLAADPELRYLDSGSPVTTFALAVNRSTRKTDGSFEDALDGFFECELFGGQAVAIAETCSKGSVVQLFGSLRQHKFQTKGEQSRTVSKIAIRVDSIAPVVSLPKESQPTPAASARAPQPA